MEARGAQLSLMDPGMVEENTVDNQTFDLNVIFVNTCWRREEMDIYEAWLHNHPLKAMLAADFASEHRIFSESNGFQTLKIICL